MNYMDFLENAIVLILKLIGLLFLISPGSYFLDRILETSRILSLKDEIKDKLIGMDFPTTPKNFISIGIIYHGKHLKWI